RRGPLAHFRCPVSELAEISSTIMSRQEVQKALIVPRQHAEQFQHRAVVASRDGQTPPYEFAHVVSGDISRQEQGIDMFPEGVASHHERVVELVRYLRPSFAHRQQGLSRCLN